MKKEMLNAKQLARLKRYIMDKKINGTPPLNYKALSIKLGRKNEFIVNIINGRSTKGATIALIKEMDEIWGDATDFVIDEKREMTSSAIMESLLRLQNDFVKMQKEIKQIKDKL